MEDFYCYLAIHTDNPGRHPDLDALEEELGRRGLRASEDRPDTMGPFAYELYVGPARAVAIYATEAVQAIFAGEPLKISMVRADKAAWRAGRPLTGADAGDAG